MLPRASQVKRSPAARHEADIARERPSVLRNERHPSEHGWWPVVQDNTYEADTFTQSAAFMAAAGEGASVPPALDGLFYHTGALRAAGEAIEETRSTPIDLFRSIVSS